MILTEEQRNVLSKLIDANWEMNDESNSEQERQDAQVSFYELRYHLIQLMGFDEFQGFMDKGKRMFA